MSDFKEIYDQHQRALAAANGHNKTVVFDALEALGATCVTVPFDGEGDSGQIDGVYCEPAGFDLDKIEVTIQEAGWGSAQPSGQTQNLSEAIETLCYGYLEYEHGGWENNDGAFGEFTLDVAARTVKLEFSGRFTDYTTDEHSF
jgi:Family of unknown function (DUF6878)